MIRTDGGTITVERREGALEVVEVTTEDGWDADRTMDDGQMLIMTFTRGRARIDVAIQLSATGITSSLSSTNS